MTGFASASDGARIAYQVEGDGPPLLLLAGQSNSHHWWDGVREDFHAVRSTVSFDYRGTGESDKPDAPYSIDLFVQDAVAVLDELGIPDADVYGTSMGGRTAQVLAAKHPRRVRRLILGCTSPGGPQAIERSNDVRRALAQPDRAAAARVLAELMYTPEWLSTHPGPHQTTGDPRMPDYARGRHLVASSRHDAWDLLPLIEAETLVLHGTEDRFNPTENAQLIAGRIPRAGIELIEGARHAYFEEFRAVAGPAAIRFLTNPD